MKNKIIKPILFIIFILPLLLISGCALIHGKSDTFAYNNTHHWYTCSLAGCSDKSHIYNKTTHSWRVNDSLEVEPTHLVPGKKVYECECGAKKEEPLYVQNRHEAGDEYFSDSTHHWQLCKYNGCEEPVMNKEEHSFEQTSVNNEYYSAIYTCTTCEHNKDMYLGHMYNSYTSILKNAFLRTLNKNNITLKTKDLENSKNYNITFNFTTYEGVIEYTKDNKTIKDKYVKDENFYYSYFITDKKYSKRTTPLISTPQSVLSFSDGIFQKGLQGLGGFGLEATEDHNHIVTVLRFFKENYPNNYAFENAKAGFKKYTIEKIDNNLYELNIILESNKDGKTLVNKYTLTFSEDEIISEKYLRYIEEDGVVLSGSRLNYEINYSYTFDQTLFNNTSTKGCVESN